MLMVRAREIVGDVPPQHLVTVPSKKITTHDCSVIEGMQG